jgi:hypothetical protein
MTRLKLKVQSPVKISRKEQPLAIADRIPCVYLNDLNVIAVRFEVIVLIEDIVGDNIVFDEYIASLWM